MPPRLQAEDLLEHRDFLRGLARSLLRDPEGAEDVVQDAFVAALERPPRSLAGLRHWLATIVRNRSFNLGRGRRRRAGRERLAAREEALPSPEDMYERLEQSRRLVETVQELRESYRSVIFLRFFEGMSVRKIARREGVSPDTVKTRVRRALAELRAKLDRRHGGDRGAWMAALVPLGRLATGKAAVATGGLVPVTKIGEILSGVLIMKKLAIGIVLGIALLGALLFRNALEPSSPFPEGKTAVPADGALAISEPEEELVVPDGQELRREQARGFVVSEAQATVAEAGSLTVTVFWETTRSPAAGVEIFAGPADRKAGIEEARRATTGDDGIVRFLRLPLGPIHLIGFRGGRAEAEVRAGEEAYAELVIPRGVDVEGIVVDPEDRPVSGAEVWIRRPGSRAWIASRVAARTDAAGRFALRSIETDRSISARSEGFAPSVSEELSTRKVAPGVPVRLTLRLRGEGGAIEGIVLNPDGAPIEGAMVLVGSTSRYAQRADGSSAPVAPPQLTRTDASGTFLADGVEAVLTELFVQASGYPVTATVVDVAPTGVTRARIRLQHGVVVEGTVKDAADNHLEGARIERAMLFDIRATAFPSPEVRTDAEGRYRIEPLLSGEIELQAYPADYEGGFAETRLDGKPGEVLTWHAVLQPSHAHTIRGSLVDALCAPVASWAVQAFEDTGEFVNWDFTDDQGRFTLSVPARGPYTVGAAPGLASRDHCLVRSEGIVADAEILLTLDAEEPAPGFVIGRLEDAGGRIGEQDLVRLKLVDGYHLHVDEEFDGDSFRLGPLRPGTYHLRVVSGTTTVLSSPPFELAPGEEHDLGVLRTELPGSLVVDFTTAAGLDVPPERFPVRAVDLEHLEFQTLTLKDGVFVGEALAPGAWTLTVIDEHVTARRVPFEIRSGEETRVTVHVEPGAYRSFEVQSPEDAEPWSEIHILVRDSAGEIFHDLRWPALPVIGFFPFGTSFPRGTSELILTTDTGLSATVSVEIGASDDEPASPTVIELH